jgi:serine/threonine protein kinase
MSGPDTKLVPRALDGGRYLLTERIGHGGMAVVWRARDTRLRVERAIKIITRQGNAGKIRAERLLREARAMTLLKHRHILAVYDHAESEEGPYVVMDYVPGGTLDDRLRESGPMAPRRAVRWMIEVLSALEHAHTNGIVHRDVKPSNVLVDATGAALLADFGIALLSDDDERHTRTGISMGSVAFMAPEQRLDARSVGPAADIYAAGATLYHLVTASTPVDLFAAEPTSPRWADLPDLLRPILIRATRQDPERRFPTATAFRRALAAVMDELDESVSSRFVRIDSGTVSGERDDLTGALRAPGRLSTMDGSAEPQYDGQVGQLVRIGGFILVGAFAVVAAALVLIGAQGAPDEVPPRVLATPQPSPVEAVLPGASPMGAPVPAASPTPAPSAVASPIPAPSAASPIPAPSAVASPIPAPSAVASPIPAPSASASPIPAPSAAASPIPAPPPATGAVAPSPSARVVGDAPAGVPPTGWSRFAPAEPAATRSAVTGRWRGSFSTDVLYLTLDGADDALRGRAWVQIPGGSRMEEHAFVGRYEAGSKRLLLEDADAAPGAGRYDLKVDAAGDLDGKWSAKIAGPQGQMVAPIHMWRVGPP